MRGFIRAIWALTLCLHKRKNSCDSYRRLHPAGNGGTDLPTWPSIMGTFCLAGFKIRDVWRYCQGSSSPSTLFLCCSSMWAPTLAGAMWTMSRVTTDIGRWKWRAGVPRWCLLKPSDEGEGLSRSWLMLQGWSSSQTLSSMTAGP